MGDPRQTAVGDLSKVIPWLVVPRFEHGTLWTRVKQRNHSAMAAELNRLSIIYSIELNPFTTGVLLLITVAISYFTF